MSIDDASGAAPDRAVREAMFEAVQRAAKPAVWSRGIELVRAGVVIGDRVESDEAHFRISARGGMRTTRVALFTDDLEWDCECSPADHACEHVAAAAIAWRQAGERAEPLPGADVGRLGYRITRGPNGLALQRVIVHPGGEAPLRGSIAAHTEGRVPGPRLVATKTDLAVELALAGSGSGPIAHTRVPKLFAALSGCDDLRLDGDAVTVSRERISPRVRVEDRGAGFVMTLLPDPAVDETFANEIVRLERVLHPLIDPPLTGREREELSRGRYVPGDGAAELVTTIVPALRRKLPVDVVTQRLPHALIQLPPRAALEFGGEGATLDVLPTIVYGDPPCARVDGERLVPLGGGMPERDAAGERRAAARLRELGLSAGVRATFEGEAAVTFKRRIDDWDGAIAGAERAEQFALAAPLEPTLELREDGFDLEFVSEGTGGSNTGRAGPGAVLQAWRDGASLVPLLEGGWAPLPADWLSRLGPFVADLLAARDEAGRVPACCSADLAALHEALDEPLPPALDGVRALLERDVAVPSAALPEDLRTELRDYQREGVDWLCALRNVGLGALLADDMGLGKTLQALCAVRGRTLVVAPTSVLVNWREEIRRHRPELRCTVYHGKARELDDAPGLTLTSYALLRLDVEQLAAVDWDVVVLDESQQIKNPDSRVAQAAYRLPAAWRLALSGTPVENRLDELWSQFQFLNPGLLGGRREFRDRTVTPIGAGDSDAARRLRGRIRPFILRRLKTAVAKELPPRTEVVLRCRLSTDERDAYDAIRAASLERVKQELKAGRTMAALETLLRLRQASCHLGLLPGREADSSAKLALLMAQLENVAAEGRRALVFSQWTALLDRTQPLLDGAGIAWTRLDGSTRDRAAVVHGFQADDGPPVMLVSLKAGGTGLTLTAADHVFMLDPWWNPAVEDQAADRAHRIGQQRPVMIYRLIAEQTVDERILALQDRKRDLARAALGDETDPAATAGLTRDDLLELLD